MASFLMVDGYSGASTNPQYPNAFELYSYSFGTNNSGFSTSGGSGKAGGKVLPHDLHCFIPSDRASQQFFGPALSGDHLTKIILVVVKSGAGPSTPSEILRMTCTGVLVSNYKVSPSSEQNPWTAVSFDCAEIEVFHGFVPPPHETVQPEHRQLMNHQKSLMQQRLRKPGGKR